MADNCDDEYILNLLNESLTSKNGSVNYDSDGILEVFEDNTHSDPDFVCEVNEIESSDDEILFAGPSTSKRGRFSTSTPKKSRPNSKVPTQHNLSDSEDSDVEMNGDIAQTQTGPAHPNLSNWQPVDMIFNEYPYNPNNEEVGINPDFSESLNTAPPYEFFSLFFDDDVIKLIVEETNRFARQCMNNVLSPHSRLAKWSNCSATEIKNFFGIVMYMGLNVLPSIAHYCKNDDLYVSNVAKVMSRNRFELLLRVLHFSNNEEFVEGRRLHKIEGLLSFMNDKFKRALIPTEKVCVDESMVPFLGRLVFKQYLKNKKHKYGIKIFKVCSEGGYCLTYKIYAGKEEQRVKGLAAKVVLEVVEPYLDFGRTVYTDNWYTSVPLAEELGKRSTHLVGTLNKARKDNPKDIVKANLKKGQVVALKNENNITVLKWKDKRDVIMLSTKHGDAMTEVSGRGGKKTMKPDATIDYNSAKAFIDFNDEMGAYSNPLRRSIKWYRKVAFDLILGTSVVNALHIYKNVTGGEMRML